MKKACTERTCTERSRSSRSGFTLVELLVVMAVLSIFGILILNIFTRTLRGSNKAQIIGVIKQNGQSVLENMDKTIRNSDEVVCPIITSSGTSPPSTNLLVRSKGIYIRYRFIVPVCSGGTCTVNGFIQQDNPVKQIDLLTGPEETEIAFAGRVCNPVNPIESFVVLTDTNPQSGVSLTTGSFTRDRLIGFKDSVKINFSLSPAVKALPSVAGQIDDVIFETTILLR